MLIYNGKREQGVCSSVVEVLLGYRGHQSHTYENHVICQSTWSLAILYVHLCIVGKSELMYNRRTRVSLL